MSLAAVVPGSGRVSSLGIPAVHSKLGISAEDHKPVDGIAGDDSTDFTSEFLQSSHMVLSAMLPDALSSRWLLLLVALLHAGGRPQIRRKHGQLAYLFPLYPAAKMRVVHHPHLGNDFADQLAVTEKPNH